MSQLIKDDDFDFEINRILALSRYRGADTREVVQVCSKIRPGDMQSWYEAFIELAQKAESSAGDEPKSLSQKSRCVAYVDRMFAAANYYRSADFFLHCNPEDPRIMSLWTKQAKCYDKALKYWGQGQRIELEAANGLKVPIIYFKANAFDQSVGSSPAPTMIMGNGYDGAFEEMLHISGIAALERGYNVILYEGPGQPTVRRYQDLGFIHDWERVVTPVVDFACLRPEVDQSKISIYGYSMGGYLSLRAAAFEPRISAVVAVDGVYDLTGWATVPECLAPYMKAGDREGFNAAYNKMVFDPAVNTSTRWLYGHGMWAFNRTDPWSFIKAMEAFTLKDVINQVNCPVYIGQAHYDIFFEGQPQIVAKALGDKAHLRVFTETEGADMHCQVGAATVLNMSVFDWLDEIASEKA